MGTRFESLIGRLSRVRQRLGEDYLQDVRQRLLESLCMKLRFGLPINLTLHEFNRAIDTVAKQHHRRPRTVELPDESHLRLQHECEEYDYQRVVGWLRAQLANGFGAEQVIEYVMHDLPLAELAAKLGITKAKARRLVDEVLELLKQRWDEDQLG